MEKPKRSAGDGKRGYNLFETMGFQPQNEDDVAEYNSMLVGNPATISKTTLLAHYLYSHFVEGSL